MLQGFQTICWKVLIWWLHGDPWLAAVMCAERWPWLAPGVSWIMKGSMKGRRVEYGLARLVEALMISRLLRATDRMQEVGVARNSWSQSGGPRKNVSVFHVELLSQFESKGGFTLWEDQDQQHVCADTSKHFPSKLGGFVFPCCSRSSY